MACPIPRLLRGAGPSQQPLHPGPSQAAGKVPEEPDGISPHRVSVIPHQPVAALVEAARDPPEYRTPTGDRRFILTGPHGEPRTVRLDQIPLPEGTPPKVVLH